MPENLHLLAETLELGPLDRISTEVSVGNFRADLVCKDINDATVVIENQFHKSDHGHLGQILTYLAGGEDVRTVIWIAESLRDEHRAALEWLNNNTSTDFAFFGVEVEAWCIGESDPAPKFEVVVRPNDWVRRQRQKARASEMEDYQRRMEYWQAFLDSWPTQVGLSPPPHAPNQGWMKLALTGGSKPPDGGGIYLYRMIAEGTVGVYLSVGRRDEVLFSQWSASLNYPSLEGGKWEQNRNGLFQIFKTLKADALDDTDWPQQHRWMRDRVMEFMKDWRNGLRDAVAALVAQEQEDVIGE
ncbi:MAG: hypothetical protein CVT70_00930 [Alphaproteobacteria bacterium HGW-Alphaproteobacteria-1]|nr:MAG: hypothetical protein CVT70_00930 [Alphaproteobacteria bacterium HGW-Alphaproteobacteria-1]